MSNFPNQFDTDVELPIVSDNITEVGGEAINALRDAVFAIEENIGINAQGTTASISERLSISFLDDGTLKPSAITSLGLVTLPITDAQISDSAQIAERKLKLDHKTHDLYNYIRDLSGDVNVALSWISATGVKLDPHLLGVIYQHELSHILVSTNTDNYLKNYLDVNRDNDNAYTVLNDLNDELLHHQWADNSDIGTISDVITYNGSSYPSNYAHTAGGIFIQTSRFAAIPKTTTDLQLLVEYIDNASLIFTNMQNLISNGISRSSRSSNLLLDGYGQAIIPYTPAIAYLRNIGTTSSPYDDISSGDDIIEFQPSAEDLANHSFEAKFSLVKVGDIIRVNYGQVETTNIIKEKKLDYSLGDGYQRFIIRIAGKNIEYNDSVIARIDKPLFNNNKYGVLSISGVNNGITMPSLIVTNPRGSEALGLGFEPSQLDADHYNLYLALYPTGNPDDGYTILPAIDVTGNAGITPGAYTLESIVEATNNAFRTARYNYRFVAFSYGGEFGIMLADPYGNAAFSILSCTVDADGFLDELGSTTAFPNNVIDLFAANNAVIDPLGLGPYRSNVASPPYMSSYGSTEAAMLPTKLFIPLRRNNFYVNAIERERMSLYDDQALDDYGDGYWRGEIINRIGEQVTYRVYSNLDKNPLKPGGTIVIQSIGVGNLIDFGRFIIKSVDFSCSPTYTDITVYNSVHAAPSGGTLQPDGYVGVYFTSDSVSFNDESATDYAAYSPFKRHFEVFIDQNGNTFTQARGRFYIGGTSIAINGAQGSTLRADTELAKINMLKISPKLRGYSFGNVTKITLFMNAYDGTTGIYDGYLASYDGGPLTKIGPTTLGKKGEATRFYDETNADYIDFIFDLDDVVSTFSNAKLDIQLFPTLSLDEEIMLIGRCQVNDTTKLVSKVRDDRQFGNISEKDLSSSALNYIALPEKLLHMNGVIRGFDISDIIDNNIFISGGLALVDGKFQTINNATFSIPFVDEDYSSSYYPINWILCVNSIGELAIIPMTDPDDALGVPVNTTRIVSIRNILVVGSSYSVDSTTFSGLLNNRKDLTPLYIIASLPDGGAYPTADVGNTISLTAYDVRRIITDQDSNIPVVLTDANSQGNFRTIDAAVNWIKRNNTYQNIFQVKGDITISSDPLLDLATTSNSIEIVGVGEGATLTFDCGSLTISNVKFKNITLIFNDYTTLSNVQIIDCIITQVGIIAATNVMIEKSNMTLANSFSISGSNTNSSIIDCTIAATEPEIFGINSFFKFNRNTITYTGAPGGGYDSTDLVNSGYGLMKAAINLTLKHVEINNNIFNTAMDDRLSFIMIRMIDYSAIIEDISISNNKFISTHATINDVRAVIAIVSSLTTETSAGSYPKFPTLVNVFIDNNICNHDQLIVITGTRSLGVFAGAAPLTINTRISGNICGAIGFLTAQSSVYSGTNVGAPNNGVIRDKLNQLIISDNTCKLITNLDEVGDYIPFRTVWFPSGTTNYVTVDTGACTIINNIASWILTGAADKYSAWGDGISILNNRLSPTDSSYLDNYEDGYNTITPPNVGIMLRIGSGTTASKACNSIIGNILHSNRTTKSNGSFDEYFYDSAIVCFNNAVITNNQVSGVLDSSVNITSPYTAMLYLGEFGPIFASNNNFDRAGRDIEAYVKAHNFYATNAVSIIDNVFSSQYIDSGDSDESTVIDIPIIWICNRNKNQIGYAVMPLAPASFSSPHKWQVADASTSSSTYGDVTPPGVLIAFTRDNAVYSDQNIFAVTSAFQNLTISTNVIGASYGARAWSCGNNIVSHVPDSTRILGLKLGAFINASSTAAASDVDSGSFSFNLREIDNNFTSITPISSTTGLTNSILDVKNRIGNFDYSYTITSVDLTNSTVVNALKANTVYYHVDTSGDLILANKDNTILLEFYYVTSMKDATEKDLIIDFSPVIIKYIW